MSTRSSITVDQVLAQWEKECNNKLPLVERDLLVLLFSRLLDEAIEITVDETTKSYVKYQSRHNKPKLDS